MIDFRVGPARRLLDSKARAIAQLRRNTPPPPSERRKRQSLRRLFRSHGHSTLIESGTYLGDTVAFLLGEARRIVSVEIDPRLHEAASRRFRKHPHVEILRGDALELIPQLIAGTDESTLLWLDGHFSGDATGRGELIEPAVAILERLGQAPPVADLTVVVDDVRLFGQAPGFPSLERLLSGARAAFPAAELWIELDALVIRNPAPSGAR